jgi:hypothetical protein
MVRKAIIVIFSLYIVLIVGFYLFQEKFIFQSKKLDVNYTYTFGKKFKEVNLKATDNSTINALHFKVENPKGVLLYFHGNKGSLKRWGEIVSPYTDYNYDVFVIDYRGYGKSNGKRSEKAMYNDALIAYHHLKKSFKESNIVVYGRSMGATFATFVASQQKPKQLILEAPFYSLIRTVNNKFPFLPYKMLLKYKFKTSDLISEVVSPTTIFHGVDDDLISIESSKELYDLSNKEITEFVSIKNGTHHNLITFVVYKEKMAAILN